MATGSTTTYSLPYPLPTDPVNVAGDIQALAGRIEYILPELTQPNTKLTVQNGSIASIAAGMPVYISGTGTGGEIQVTKSNAATGSTMPAIGIAAQAIGSTHSGDIVISGVVDADLNTNAYTIGQILYVAVGGGLTGTAPVYPDLAQQIAMVVKVSASTGRIMMLSGGGGNSGPVTWGQLANGL